MNYIKTTNKLISRAFSVGLTAIYLTSATLDLPSSQVYADGFGALPADVAAGTAMPTASPSPLADDAPFDCKTGCKTVFNRCGKEPGGSPGAEPSPGASSSPLTPTPSASPVFTDHEAWQHCMTRAGIVDKLCRAIDASEEKVPMDEALLALDIVGAAICGSACAASTNIFTAAAATALSYACAAAGIAVGGTEIGMSLASNEKFMKSLIPIAGVADGAILGGLLLQSSGGSSTNMSGQVLSCVATGILAATAGVRAMDMMRMKDTKHKNCKKAERLFSKQPSIDENLNGSGGGTKLSGSGGLSGSSGGTGTRGGGASTDSSGGGGQSSAAMQCIANSGLSNCLPNSSGATDANMLSKTDPNGLGLDRFAANKAGETGLDPSALAKKVEDQGVGPAMNAVGSQLGLSPDMAAALGSMAEDGASLSPAVMGSEYSGGGGHGGGGGSGGGAPDFSSLFGGGQQGPGPASVGGSMSFGKSNPSDIWHTGTSMNIFQIVSGKIEKVSDRVIK